MFAITGKIEGKTYKLKYQQNSDRLGDYTLSGDDVAINKMLAESKINHGMLGLPPEDWSFEQGYFNGDLPAFALASEYVFDEIISESNDWEPFNEDVVY